MAGLAGEQENYVRLSLLLTGVSPKAVRSLFDREFDPSCLTSSIRKEYKKIRQLYMNKHINNEQWKLLNGGTKRELKSTDFDVTLMITLLRNLANIQGPRTGYDVLPQPTDKCEGADLARLKYYRNFMAHIIDDNIDDIFVNTAWEDICNAIERLGGSSLRSQCDKLKNGTLDQSNVEILKEVRLSNLKLLDAREDIEDLKDEMRELKEENDKLGTAQEKIVSRLWDDNKHISKEAKYLHKHFIETESYRKIVHAIEKHKCVAITGPPGCGKFINSLNAASSLQRRLPSHYLCLDSHIKDFLDSPCIRRTSLMHTFNLNIHSNCTVHVLDGFFGKSSFNERNFISWKEQRSSIKIMLRTNEGKLVLTCRSDIYESYIKGNLGIPVHECPVLYDENEINQICNALLTSEVQLPKDSNLLTLMPALCSLHDCELFLEDIDTISNVTQLIDTVLQRIKDNSIWGYRALVLLCMTNNNLDKGILRKSTHSHDEILRKLFLETGERVSSIKEKLERALSSTKFLEETDTGYRFMHEWLFDYVATFVGKYKIDIVLDCSDSSFFRDRVCLEASSQIKDGSDINSSLTIELPPDWKQDYHKRIRKDLRDGQLWNVIGKCHNRQSEFDIVLDWFKKNKTTVKDVSDNSTGLHIATYFGCTDLVRILVESDYSEIKDDQLEIQIHQSSPLYYACSIGYIDIVRLLVNTCSDTRYHCYRNPLYAACANEHCKVVALLMNTLDYDNDDSFLQKACDNGNQEIVQILISNGVRVNQSLPSLTPLHIAAFNGHTDIIRILLNQYASVNIEDQKNATPLLMAAYNGHTDIVDILLKHYATMSSMYEYRLSPVYASVKNGHADTLELLLKNNANVNTSFQGITVLGVACSDVSENVVEVLLKYDADIENCGNNSTALHRVCQSETVKDKTKIVQMLLKKNVNINKHDRAGNTPLYYALTNSDFKISELLIQNGATVKDISYGNFLLPALAESENKTVLEFLSKNDELKGLTLIYSLISAFSVQVKSLTKPSDSNVHEQNFTNIFELLLSNDTDMNQCNNDGYSPLTFTCKVGNDFCIPRLLKHGANINGIDENGNSPLYEACLNAQVDVVNCLLENKANVNQKCSDGSTALHAVISCIITKYMFDRKVLTIINILFTNGADIDLVDKNEKSVLHIICENTVSERKVVGILLENKPDLTLTVPNGFTALHSACLKGHTDIVACLLKHWTDIQNDQNLQTPHLNHQPTEAANSDDNKGQDSIPNSHGKKSQRILLDISDDKGQTPLHIACIHGHLGIIEMLLRSGAFVDAQDSNGCTPLYLACKNDQENAAKFLIQRNANVNMACCKGWTPLHVACFQRNGRIANLLLQNGVDKSIKDINGLTAQEIASEKGLGNIKELSIFTYSMSEELS